MCNLLYDFMIFALSISLVIAVICARYWKHQAKIDPLTGLLNRRAFHQRVEKHRSDCCCLLYLDLDDFKSVNDKHGHEKGDQVLIEAAQVCAQTIRRERDVLCRFGGEEFIVFLPKTDITRAYQVAERIRKSIELRGHVTVSIGVCAFTVFTKQALREADRALYEAKTAERDEGKASEGEEMGTAFTVLAREK